MGPRPDKLKGLTNAQIAASLNIGRSTVKRRVSSIMWKLDVHTRRDAVREASKHLEAPYPIEATEIRSEEGASRSSPCLRASPMSALPFIRVEGLVPAQRRSRVWRGSCEGQEARRPTPVA